MDAAAAMLVQAVVQAVMPQTGLVVAEQVAIQALAETLIKVLQVAAVHLAEIITVLPTVLVQVAAWVYRVKVVADQDTILHGTVQDLLEAVVILEVVVV
jgi:hypothetical protein